ncbi:MAG: AAA family ATPase [Blastocatellia bacterium]
MGDEKDDLQREIESLQRRRDTAKDHLLRIQERMSEFPQQNLIPLDLTKSEDDLRVNLKELDEKIAELEARKSSEPEDEKPAPSAPSPVPFTNREDEIRGILSSTAPAYHLLYGPMGYGKTELLKRLDQRFREQKWYCAFVTLDENSSGKDLADSLAEQFEIPISTLSGIQLSWQIGGGLKQMWEGAIKKDARKEGLVLLIDLEKVPSMDVLYELIETYIPNMERSLRVLVDFYSKHNRFRVIIAGRNLGTHLKAEHHRLPLNLLKLSPFDYDVIRGTATEYLPDDNQTDIDQLSAHLFFLTGGHPGCMAHTLEMYKDKGMPPDVFLEHYGSAIWRSVVRDCIESTLNEIPSGHEYLRELLERASVFRFLDYRTLRELNEGLLPKGLDEYYLADALTTRYLLEWKGRFLKDEITRRLLTVKLRNEAPHEFPKRCEQVIEICKDRLRLSNVNSPETWTIEVLYQSLQCRALHVQEPEQRSKMRDAFPRQILGALEIFYDRKVFGKNMRSEKEALMQAIREDWEFQFTVNYYLRDDNYNEEPYKKMVQQIDTFFA